MAKKVMLMKLLQELRGYENVTNRRPAAPTPMLYLMQLRQRNTQAETRRLKTSPRRAIATAWPNPAEPPAPIKIHHTFSEPNDLPVMVD